MFSNCISLISLPNISKWNTNNLADMKYLFSDCFSISILPDISKWNNYNGNDINLIPDYNKLNDLSNLDFFIMSDTQECQKMFDDPLLLEEIKIEKMKRLNLI